MESLQKTFIEEFQKSKCLSVCLGQRKSGKTVFSMCILREAMEQRAFGAYYLVIPSFNKEQNNEYDFLNKLIPQLVREQYEVYLFNEFNDVVIQMVREKQAQNGGRDALLLVDDSTAFIAQYIRRNNVEMNRLLTELRHKDLNCSFFLICHSLRGVLSPLTREMLTFLFVFDCTTKNTLEAIYDEYYSVQFDSYKEWKKNVWLVHCKPEYKYTPLCFYTLQGGKYDLNTKDWYIYSNNIKTILSQGKK